MPLGRYRSAAFQTIEEELENSKTNPLVVGYTYNLINMINNPDVENIGGYDTLFNIYLPLIRSRWSFEFTAPDSRYDYWPERLSYDLYDTEDVWYILMRLNSVFTRNDFVGSRFTCVSIDHVGKLLKICKRIKIQSNTGNRDDITYKDRTLKQVHV